MGSCISVSTILGSVKCEFCSSRVFEKHILFINFTFCSVGCKNAYKRRLLLDNKKYTKL